MEQKTLTFDQLPKAVTLLTKEINDLKELITQSIKKEPAVKLNEETFLNIQEAGNLLSLSVATIYSKVSKGEIPVMKRGKRLYFSRTELLDYIKVGRKKTVIEVDALAESYFNNKK